MNVALPHHFSYACQFLFLNLIVVNIKSGAVSHVNIWTELQCILYAIESK